MHNILDNDDPDIIECKDEYNEALVHYKEVQALHEHMEGNYKTGEKLRDTKIDAKKLEEMKKNYDPKSEQIFNTAWDI